MGELRRTGTGRTERARTLYYIAAAVLAALVPLILFAGLWVRAVFHQSDRDLSAHLTARAGDLSAQIDSAVEQQLAVLSAMAFMPSLDEPDATAFQGTAGRMVSVLPHWLGVSLVDAESGRVLANTAGAFGESAPRAQNWESLRQAAEERRSVVFVSAPDDAAADRSPIIHLAVPVLREGRARFTLLAAVSAAAIQGLVESGVDGDILGVVVDERDRVLARSKRYTDFVGREANRELKARTSGRSAGLFTAESVDADDVLTAFRRSPVTGWLAVLATDRSHFATGIDRATWALVGTGALALTLAGVLAVFLFYNVMERRVSDERYEASRALSALDARLLKTTQDALAEQRKAASEREVLLREIYHRVKNNLQIIQSLLRLGSRDLDPEQREPFESAIRRIGAMARVHSLLYKSPDLASLDFKDYLDDLVRETAESLGADVRGIRTELSLETLRVPLDTAVPLAFITVEILTNSFKHAFPEGRGGTVRVAVWQVEGRGVLVISDDGVGVPGAPESQRALGLTLVTKLVEQIGGQLHPPMPGHSEHRVEFPLAHHAAAILPPPSPRTRE